MIVNRFLLVTSRLARICSLGEYLFHYMPDKLCAAQVPV